MIKQWLFKKLGEQLAAKLAKYFNSVPYAAAAVLLVFNPELYRVISEAGQGHPFVVGALIGIGAGLNWLGHQLAHEATPPQIAKAKEEVLPGVKKN